MATAACLGGPASAQIDIPTQPGRQGSAQDSAADWLTPLGLLDQDLPKWFQLNGQYRNRVERSGHIQFRPDSDTYDLNQFRFNLSVQPIWWLNFQAELQTADVFFNQRVASAPPYQNTWDLRQAFVMLGNAKKGWFDVVAGRQNLAFGSERLVGPSDWLNQGRTFDAARVDLHHGGVNVSLFSSSVIVARDGVIDHHLSGNNLHGVYSSLEKLAPKATLEPYVLWRVAPAGVRLSENAGLGALNEVTFGFLWKGQLPAQLDYEVEMARQLGSLGPKSIYAWAGSWHVGRSFDHVAGKPHPFIEANHASGTRDPASNRWGTFDQIYPSSHNKLGFADQVGWRNIYQVRPGIVETIRRDWKLNVTYENFWLASARDGLYASSGALVSQSASGTAGRHVGQEVDAWAEWKFRRSVEVGFGYARFFPGEFLRATTPGKPFNYPFFYATWHLTRMPEL